MQDLKICKKCGRELPNNSDYYFSKYNKLVGVCKECQGKNFTDKLSRIAKEGYRICKKCNRELPETYQYYPNDKLCVNGLKPVCRECHPKFKRFLSDDYIHPENWTTDDLELLKNIYSDYTNQEIIDNYFPTRSKRSLESIADKYGFSGKSENTTIRCKKEMAIKNSIKLKGRTFSDERKKNMSILRKEYFKTHDVGDYIYHPSDITRKKLSVAKIKAGKWKGNSNPNHINPPIGEKNGRWKGGINPLIQELRSEIKQWKFDSMKFCDYLCVISGDRFENIHHLIPFINIVDEAFDLCNLDKRKQVLDYNEVEFDYIKSTLNSLHNKYGHGICLSKEIHELFHKNYNYYNNTPIQFLEFVKRLEVGEFDDWLQENNLQLNINYRVIDYIKSSLLLQQTA